MLAELGYPEVRVPHLRILLYLREDRGIRMSHLAERLQLTAGAVTQLVAHLEQHGLVERVRDPQDGRAVQVRPTAKTQRGYAASRARVAELVTGMEKAVGKERWEVFRDVLGEVVAWQEGRVVPEDASPDDQQAGHKSRTGSQSEGG